MNSQKLQGLSPSELEARLTALRAETTIPDELRQLVHELEIHQVELEMQNHDLREAQQALEESRDRYAELYDGAPVGYLTLRANGTIREINLTAAAMIGVERQRLAGRSLVAWLALSDRPRLLAFLRHPPAAEKARGVDLRLCPAHGGERMIRLQAMWSPDPDNAAHIYRAAMIDVSEQARAQAAVRESERRLRTIFENATVGMAEMALDDRILRVNQRLAAITGYDEYELTTMNCADLIHPADLEAQEELTRRLVRGEIASYTLENRIVRKDGKVIWVDSSAALLGAADGPPDRCIVVAQDITARKHAEEALREAGRRKDEFLMMLGHELRNPLAPVRNAAEVLRQHPADPQQVRWAAELIGRQTDHMTRLVDDLLDVARITHGSIQLQAVDVDLRDAVERAAEQAVPRLEERHQRLDMQLPAAAVGVHGDPVRLAQIVANLLINASKFSPPEAEIRLSLEEAAGEARLRVSDQGMGIPQDLLPHIFEPFVQGAQSQERGPGGLGLGLALSRGLAQMHGGRLEADSAGADRGSAFTLHLPLVGAAPAPAARPAAEPPARGLSILVVDDNRDVAESTAMLLGLAGHDAQAVGDGEAALAAVDRLHPEVILLDIGLPGMDGFEVARRLRQSPAGAQAAILAVSGYDLSSGPNRERAAVFDGHLLKPVGLKAILAAIERHRPQTGRFG